MLAMTKTSNPSPPRHVHKASTVVQTSKPAARLRIVLQTLACLGLIALTPAPAWAGKMSWLDDVLQQVIQESRGGDTLAGASARATGRLFTKEADEALAVVARRHDELTNGARSTASVSDAVLDARFARLVRSEPRMARVFAELPATEKRLVVEMTETTQRLARRYPSEAEGMIRSLGTDGLSAVRVWGDDVAPVLAREGNSAINVLRKTGQNGWAFFNSHVLPNKTKLVAAGVMTAFLVNPEKFIDTAGRITEYAAREFARAGISLAGAVGGGLASGLEQGIGAWLEGIGLNLAILRYLGMGFAAIVVILSAGVILGLPLRWLLAPARLFVLPIHWVCNLFRRKSRVANPG